ncbi:MAG: N-acetyltransferase family protein [Pseudomonadota bacterium]
MTTPFIRSANEADMPAVLAIHNSAVAETAAIWTETQVDLEDRLAWWKGQIANDLPVYVADVDGVCAGFATYGPYRPKEGYRFTQAVSIYIDTNYRRRGLAKALLEALEAHARTKDVHVLIGGIEAGNAASIALHAKLGFVETGRLPQVGWKFDRWLDLVLMQKILD